MKQYYFEDLLISMYPSDLLHSFGINGKISGSIYAVGEMQGVLPVIHGPRGCGYHYRFSARRRHYPYFNVISSDLSEKEIIYGGEEKLYQTVCDAYQRYHPKLILVIPTPASDIIHDDLEIVAAKARKKGIPTVAAKSETFSHRDKNFSRKRLAEVSKQKPEQQKNIPFDTKGCGYTEALLAIIENIMEKQDVQPRTVNIETIAWGKHGRQVIEEIKKTLWEVNVQVISYFPSDSYENIVQMPAASLNIVRRIKWAKKMEEKFGTPFLAVNTAGKYQGLDGICHFYHDIGEFLGISEEMDALIADKKKKTSAAVCSFKKTFAKYHVILISRNLQSLPLMIKKYQDEFGFKIRCCCGIYTPKHREYLQIDDRVYENLVLRVRDTINQYTPQTKFIMNPSDEELMNEVLYCQVAFGTDDPYYEKLGIPLIHSAEESMPLSFEAYVRSMGEVYEKVSCSKNKPDLLINALGFDREDPLILDEKNIQAARKMWVETWFQKGK